MLKVLFKSRNMRRIILLAWCLLLAACSQATELAATQDIALEQNSASTPHAAEPTSTPVVPTQTPTTERTATPTATDIPPTATPTTTPIPEEETEEPKFIDYSAIAGQWFGWGEEVSGFIFWVEINLESGALISEPVGTVSYGLIEGNPDCNGTLFALSPLENSYRAREVITDGNSCDDGVVELALDTQIGTLLYKFSSPNGNPLDEASGELMREQ